VIHGQWRWHTGHVLTDFLDTATRSRVMSRIRSKNTKPELALRRGLWAAGVRGWRVHAKRLPGKPDLAFGRRKLAVFVDGCFWHGHPDFFTPGKSGPYWDAKIERTKERDRLANDALAAEGWAVLRFWDFEIEDNLARCLTTVITVLADSDTVDPQTRRAADVRQPPALDRRSAAA
jgi:DNA mismatch endonuclease (patch repair protein)